MILSSSQNFTNEEEFEELNKDFEGEFAINIA